MASIHSEITWDPSTSTAFVASGGICPGPRRFTRSHISERLGEPGTTTLAPATPRSPPTGWALQLFVSANRTWKRRSICDVVGPPGKWQCAQLPCM